MLSYEADILYINNLFALLLIIMDSPSKSIKDGSVFDKMIKFKQNKEIIKADMSVTVSTRMDAVHECQ